MLRPIGNTLDAKSLRGRPKEGGGLQGKVLRLSESYVRMEVQKERCKKQDQMCSRLAPQKRRLKAGPNINKRLAGGSVGRPCRHGQVYLVAVLR